MSETNDKLKAAVERLRCVEKDGLGLMASIAQWRRDQLLVIRAYVKHLDEQQRIAAERALPIDVEWLESIGFAVHAETSFTYKHIELHRTESGEWHCWIRSALGTHACYLADAIQTQGDMLDLLAALKIETKGT